MLKRIYSLLKLNYRNDNAGLINAEFKSKKNQVNELYTRFYNGKFKPRGKIVYELFISPEGKIVELKVIEVTKQISPFADLLGHKIRSWNMYHCKLDKPVKIHVPYSFL